MLPLNLVNNFKVKAIKLSFEKRFHAGVWCVLQTEERGKYSKEKVSYSEVCVTLDTKEGEKDLY